MWSKRGQEFLAKSRKNVWFWLKIFITFDEGAQVDLVIDRRDNVINLCEIKFSSSEYVIDKAYSKELKHKRDVFKEQTKTRKAVHLTMITTEGVKRNAYFNDIQSEVSLDQLFID